MRFAEGLARLLTQALEASLAHLDQGGRIPVDRSVACSQYTMSKINTIYSCLQRYSQPQCYSGFMTDIISIKDFSMRFGDVRVIDKLSFSVRRGETFGLLGSNGSGKTTTIRALLGIYPQTSGELLVDGKPYSVSGTIRLGYLPEERGLYKKESVIDTMMYFGQLKGLSRDVVHKESLAFLERVGLSDKAKTRLDKLSGGQQQKVQLGITIMGDPELLILDEPTKGFDPVNRRLLMKIIEEHQKKGATVVLVTHQMEEVERLCDRIILLKDGKAAAYGTVKEVRKAHDGKSLDDIFVAVYGGEDKEEDANA